MKGVKQKYYSIKIESTDKNFIEQIKDFISSDGIDGWKINCDNIHLHEIKGNEHL